MFSHIHLLAVLLTPVLAYLAAALIFSLVAKKRNGQAVPVNTGALHYHDGQHK